MEKPAALVAKTSSGLGARVVWFAVIWLGSVAALSVVAFLIRWAVKP